MQVGGVVGQYRITGLLGHGGMGAVYAAEHALLGRPAAVKLLLPELSRDQEIVTRFFNEARAATAVRHPGIVEIYDFGWQPDGSAYIAMERLDGESLATRAARGRIGWSAALAIARQIAGVLAAAHARGIVHRDLKPDNVFLVADPEVPGGERIKLLDFGIAKLVGETPQQGQTRTGAVIGTPTYMAPEQCRGVPVDHRADLYAVGCIVFALCTGRPPFLGDGSGDVLAAHIHVPPPTLKSLGVKVPSEVERLVRRMLAKLPAERVQTAGELVQAIDAVLAKRDPAGTRTQVPGAVTSAPQVETITTLSGSVSMGMPSTRGRYTRYWGIGAALAVGVVGAITYVATTADEPAPPQLVVVPHAPEPAPAPPPPEPAPPPPEPAPAPEPAPPATVELAIDSTPSGAEVVLAGVVLGRTPLRSTLPRGDRDVSLVIRLRGHSDKTVSVRPDQPIAQRVRLTARPAARPPNRDGSVNPFK